MLSRWYCEVQPRTAPLPTPPPPHPLPCLCVCPLSFYLQVGSGFDVSSAVYGSQTYSRFSPSVLQPVLSPPLPPPPPTSSSAPAPPEEAGGGAALTSVPPQALVRCVLGE